MSDLVHLTLLVSSSPQSSPALELMCNTESTTDSREEEKEYSQEQEENAPLTPSQHSSPDRNAKRDRLRAKYDAAINHHGFREDAYVAAAENAALHDRVNTLTVLETRQRLAITDDCELHFQHLCRDFKIDKGVVDRIEADIKASEEELQNMHSDALDAYTQHLRKKPDNAEILEIQMDRRRRVGDLLTQNRRSEELRCELDERKAYTKQIAKEVQKQELERCEAIHDASIHRQHVINESVNAAVEEQRAHTHEDTERRRAKVSEQLQYVREKGNFAHKVAIADAAKIRTSELKATSDHLRRGFVRKGGRAEVENDSQSRLDNAEALAELRHKEIMKKMMKSERNTMKVLRKRLKKKEADRAKNEELVEGARVHREQARERQELAHEERQQELREFDDANEELRQRIQAEGNARRAAQRREAASRYEGLQERVGAVQSAPDPRKQQMELFGEEIERSRAAHKERVEREAEIDAETRQRKEEAFLKRHEAESALQQELILLRENHAAQHSRMWRDRYQAKVERAEVAKLQNLVRNKNTVMAAKADSLMAQEAVEMNRANDLVVKRTKVEKQLQESSQRVDLKRKLLQGLYGKPLDNASNVSRATADRYREESRSPANDGDDETALQLIWGSSPNPMPFMTLFVDTQSRENGSAQQEVEEEELDATAISLIRSEAQSPYLELVDDLVQEETRASRSRSNSPVQRERAATAPLEDPETRRTKLVDTEARKRVRHEFEVKRRKPQFKPSRVVELPKPGGFAVPSLAYPTHNLLANAKISEDLRVVVERLMTVQHEVDAVARARWREKAGIQHTPERMEPLLISSPSERLTKRTIAYEANLVKTAKDSTIPTIHDDVEPVSMVSKRLYDPDAKPKPKPNPTPKTSKPKTQFTEEYFVKKFFDDPQVAMRKSREASVKAALHREDPRMPTKRLDSSGEDELNHRLSTPIGHMRRLKPKPKSRPASALSDAAAIDRFYNSRLVEESQLSKQLDAEYMKPLRKTKVLKPEAVKASADRLSQPKS